MVLPRYIQRCNLERGKLKYEYMGSAEFESGDQPKSLKRIFEKGMHRGSATINVKDNEVVVYMVAAEDFPFDEYQPYLQQLADGELRLQEFSNFGNSANALVVGIDENRWPPNDAWLDFENDVLWTIDESKREVLVSALEAIKTKWSRN